MKELDTSIRKLDLTISNLDPIEHFLEQATNRYSGAV